MMQEITISTTHPFFTATLPLPPGINQSYSVGRGIIATKALAQFKHDAALVLCRAYTDYELIAQIRHAYNTKPYHHTALSMDINFYFSSLWKRDIDGGIKAVIDAVFHKLDINDNLIVELHVSKEIDKAEPRVEVSVRCLLDSGQRVRPSVRQGGETRS